VSVDNAVELVRDDILRGLSSLFEPVSDEEGDGFEVARDFRDIAVVSNDDIASVVWTYRCRHVDWFNNAAPSGAVLTIRGTTTVDTRPAEPLYHRYIDWLAVYSALGYTLYQRQMVDVPDRDAINFGPSGPSLEG
jgi:hypothetical protein